MKSPLTEIFKSGLNFFFLLQTEINSEKFLGQLTPGMFSGFVISEPSMSHIPTLIIQKRMIFERNGKDRFDVCLE